jgi:regulatory protein
VEDSEKLATVTYLPGVRPPSESMTESSTNPRPPAEPDEAHPAEERGRAVEGDREAQERRAENVSMHALTRRGLSRAELGDILLSRDLEGCVVESELDRLERVGLIDDGALAETILRTQRERKGLGRAALTVELRRRRLDPEAIELALEQLDEGDEQRQATELAVRRAKQFHGLDHETAVRRLGGYLQRKGYSSDIVRTAVVAALPRPQRSVRFR